MRPRFAVGSDIAWKQYAAKGDTAHVIRTGAIWSDAPSFEGGGAYVWVVPNEPRLNEKSAIAVRVHRGGARRGDAEVFEDSTAYRESLRT